MAAGTENELTSFHRFLSEKLTAGAAQVSPEEALDLWRAGNPARDEYNSTVVALREALADMEAGEQGLLLEEFDREFRDRQ